MNFSSLATMPWMGAVLTALALGGSVTSAQAQSSGVVNAICATDQSWCELAAQEFSKATGIKVNQTVKATGEALAQLRAESSNPKTFVFEPIHSRGVAYHGLYKLLYS